MPELKALDTEHASWIDEADAAGEIRCVCVACGAINQAKSYLINTPNCYEWEVICTACGEETVVDEPDADIVSLALLVKDLRKELEDLRDELDPRHD